MCNTLKTYSQISKKRAKNNIIKNKFLLCVKFYCWLAVTILHFQDQFKAGEERNPKNFESGLFWIE